MDKVHTIVVYKIDRLTRSLMDFSKLVDIFDEYGVTFVSVTQSFNTTTSMGRLTLNVLLSFAQFEREVSAERIRDKFAASKKKGMWMGGMPPLGYEVKDRKLLISPEHSTTAIQIFGQYLSLGCVAKLKRYLDAKGIKSPKRLSSRGNQLGGNYYSRGALYNMLSNPVYIGKIKHKDNVYEGLHDGIIDEDIWKKVQQKLSDQAAKPRGHTKASQSNLLKGLLFDNNGVAYSPVFTKKGNKAYRYYISQNTLSDNNHPDAVIQRIPAHTLETKMIAVLKAEMALPENLSRLFENNNGLDDYIAKQSNCLNYEGIITTCINKIVIMNDALEIHLNIQSLKTYLEDTLKIHIEIIKCTMHVISNDFKLQKSYRGALIEKPDGDKSDPLDLPPQQLKNLIRGVVWREDHFNGMSIKAIAEREGISKSSVGQIIIRSFDTLMAI